MKVPFFSRDSWDIESVNPPWGDRPSIYEHILKNICPGEPGLGETGDLLPDDEIVSGGNQIRFAPGLFDAQIDHEVSSSEATEIANKIFESFRALTQRSTDERASSLYSLLLEHSTLPYVDHLLEMAHDELDPERMRSIAHWLAIGAADREPVKCAIALLGVCHGGDDRDLLLTLGRHEEFTLFASVALQNLAHDPELSLWALACLVTGWGRIQIIERLAETKDEQIRAWMLREGYRNEIGEEYTALICAKTGELSTALLTSEPDDKLLKGAGSILTALIDGRGGSSEGIEAYKEGPEATELYLIHLQTRDIDLQGFIDVSTIDEFLNEEEDETGDLAPGWLERSANLLGLTNAILSRPGWEQKVRDGLSSDDRHTFWTASQAARMLGIDVWDIYFERLKRGEPDPGLWFGVLHTNDTDRIERVIAFAEEMLPLNDIASGPADSLGLGPEFEHHFALDTVLQKLRRFPGKGWPLIRAGLQSPVVRNRNSAVKALAAWDRSTWSEEAAQLLTDAIQVEPNDDTRATMVKALEGESACED
jgi:hypothetical protein